MLFAKLSDSQKIRLRVKTDVENLADRSYSQSIPEDPPRSLQTVGDQLQRLLPVFEQ